MKFLDEIGPAGHLISSRDPFARSLGAKTCLLDGQSDSLALPVEIQTRSHIHSS